MEVTREVWSNMRYTYNEQEKKIEEEELGIFRQFPLRLAWAITIHKSQGLTFRKVTIDFTGGVFAGGAGICSLEPLHFIGRYISEEGNIPFGYFRQARNHPVRPTIQ